MAGVGPIVPGMDELALARLAPPHAFGVLRSSRLLLALLLFPAAAGAADLLEVYREALGYDAQFAVARAALGAGRERMPQGLAGLLPVLGLSASTVKNGIDYEARPSTGVIPTRYNSSGWTVSLTQPLFRWQNWASYRQSELAVAHPHSRHR